MDNILIKVTSESNLDDLQRQLQELTIKASDYEAELQRLKKAEKEDIEAIKKLGLSEEQLAKRLKDNANYYSKEVQYKKDDIKETKNSIKALNDQIKTQKLLQGASGRAVQQLRAMRETLMQMEEAGEFGSNAFIDLSIKAAELEDQIGDTQQRIRILASDTKELDAVMGLGDGLAGTFYIATSAAEIFGDDLEGLQKAFYKVQAALSIVNGLQQVSNALNKDSNINVVLSTALKKKLATAINAESAATGKATIKQKLLNLAMKANPAGVLITAISALVAVYTAMSTILSRVGDSQARLNKLQADNKSQEISNFYSMKIELEQAAGASALELARLEKKAAEEEYNVRYEAYIKAQRLYNEANAFNRSKRKEEYDEAKEAYNEAFEAREKANTKFHAQEISDMISQRKELNQTRVDLMQDGADKEIAQIRNSYDERLKELKGETELELQLRAELIKKQNKEIAEVRRKYQVQEQQTRIDMMRDGEAKEIAQIEHNLKEQKRQYQGNSKEMVAMRKALEDKAAREIADIRRRHEEETEKTLTEVAVTAAEERTKKLTGAEGVQGQLKVWDEYYNQRKYQIEENARLESEEVQRSTDSEEVKAAKIQKINADAQAAITDITREQTEKRIEIQTQEIAELERAADMASFDADHKTGQAKIQALKDNLDAQMDLYYAQEDRLTNLRTNGLISEQEYNDQMWEITKNRIDAEKNYEMSKFEEINNEAQKYLGKIQEVSDMVFGALLDNVQAQMDALDEMYTTDAEEAKENANKRYLTEKELQDRRTELEIKQAKYQKAQGIMNAIINTALSITSTLAQFGATPWGIAASVIAAAMGTAQIAIISAQQLPKYAKGRKGGKGEYAMVGEKGPELMYIPDGASIVPNDKVKKQNAWAQFDVPRLDIPQLPSVNTEYLRYAPEQTAMGLDFDYDKLGAAVAKNLPKQKSVTVNVDRNGVTISDGGDTHRYLNKKYQASWN